MKPLLLLLLTTMTAASLKAQVEPCGPVPTDNQLRWQDMEMYAFIHYSLNTYTDEEWGYGNEDPQLLTKTHSCSTPAVWIADNGHGYVNRRVCVASSLLPSITAGSACGPLPIRSTR